MIGGVRSVMWLDVVLLCSSGPLCAKLVTILVVGLAWMCAIWSELSLVLVCLSGSGVVDVLCVLPSGGIMWFDPSGAVLSWSVRGSSRCHVCPLVMAMVAVMSVGMLSIVMMVAVLHYRCREVDQFWLCMVFMSIYVHWLAVGIC
jgi:hypothetical protein